MAYTRKPSQQTLAILAALAGADWLYGLELAELTGLKSGSLYPILIRLDERGLLESRWLESAGPGRPPRHAYRLLPAGREYLEAAQPAAATPRLKPRLA